METRRWRVIETERFHSWFVTLDSSSKEDILAKVEVLSRVGPSLGRPQVDTLKGSGFPNMKELRVQSGGRPYRLLFAFDPKRQAILLVGGNKASFGKNFYRTMIPLADNLYSEYLERLKHEKD